MYTGSLTKRTRPRAFVLRCASYLHLAGWTVDYEDDADGGYLLIRAESPTGRKITIDAFLKESTGNWNLGHASYSVAGMAPYFYAGYSRIAALVSENCEDNTVARQEHS